MPNQYSGRPRVSLNCETCGGPFVVKAYKATTARFCSRKCQGAPSVKHGEARNGKRTPEYSIWQAMVDRCQSPGNPFYADYAGRGITVCDSWRSYENFIRDMGRRPAADLSLERLDNDLGYFPENCVWQTRTHQQRNKRDNRYLTVNGKTRLCIEWAELMGINHETVRGRLLRGWSPEQAVGVEPPPVRGKSLTVGGVTRTVAEWSKIAGVTPDAIRLRVAHGWSLERAVGLRR